jgi:diguanylate cyclase (GGDEF)-like protein
MSNPTLNWLGEFAASDLEQRYQQGNFDQTRRRMAAICWITATAYLAAIAINYLDFGWSAPLGIMLGCRMLVFALGLTAAILATRPALYSLFTPVMMVYMTSLGISETVEALLQLRNTARPLVPVVLIVVLMYYVFIPKHLYVALIPSLLTSVIYLVMIAQTHPVMSSYFIDFSLFFLLTNLYGTYHDIAFNRVRRQEFYVLIEQQRLNQELQREVAIRQAMEAQLRQQATTDALTGIYNRRYFMELFSTLVQRDRTGLSLLMLDIDHFKSVNDTYGHDVGDLALQHFVATVQTNLRVNDVIARLGGEEFVVLLPNTPIARAADVAQRLCQHVAHTPLKWSDGELPMTVSIGLAAIAPAAVDDHDCLVNILKRADHALYQAKHNGRNQVVCEPDRQFCIKVLS